MTYPPGSPGYPPAQQGNQYATPTQQFGRVGEPVAAGPSKLPAYLAIAVLVFGLATYAFNFGPMLTITNSDFPQFGSASGSTPGLGMAVAASVLAALLAAVGLIPKQKSRAGLVAVVSVLSFLLVLAEVINAPTGLSIGWGLYLVIASTVLQAGAAIAALLFEAGVLTAPEPKPRYEQQSYGQQQYGAQYYGQQYGGPAQSQQQRPGYPSQYGGYQGAPTTGGFSSAGSQGAPSAHAGPPTPPTGFPAFGQPASGQQSRASEATGYQSRASEATGYGQGSSAPTTSVPAQPSPGPAPQTQSESSPQSGSPSS